MALLSRDEILAKDDLKVITVAVPEWGGEVLLKTLTAAERDKFEESVANGKNGKNNLANLRARLVSRCIVDENGKRMFEAADVARLGTKSVAALQLLFNKCNEMNAMSEADIESLVEDFDAPPSEDSSSD